MAGRLRIEIALIRWTPWILTAAKSCEVAALGSLSGCGSTGTVALNRSHHHHHHRHLHHHRRLHLHHLRHSRHQSTRRPHQSTHRRCGGDGARGCTTSHRRCPCQCRRPSRTSCCASCWLALVARWVLVGRRSRMGGWCVVCWNCSP